MRALLIGQLQEAERLLVETGLEVERVGPRDAALHLQSQRHPIVVVDARADGGVELVRALAPLCEGAPLIACVSGAAAFGSTLAAGATDVVELPGDEARLSARAHLVASGTSTHAQRAADVTRRLLADHLALVESAADGVFSHEAEANVMTYANPAFVAFLGYQSDSELLGRPVLDLLHRDDRALVAERIRGIVTRGQPSRPHTVRFVGRDGTTLFAETRGMLVSSGSQRVVTVIARDLTERRKAELLQEQLQQSQKMEVVGRLAGGIAHDFNNILTTIRGYGDLLLERVPLGSPAFDAAQHIRRSAIRAAGLTEQLLVFTRRRPPQPRLVQLNDMVRQMGGLLTRVIGEDIQLQLRLQPFLARARVDPGQMEQMLLNLAINARDAMAKGGHLTIETRDHGATQVRLTVEDEGHGIDEETRRRIFEPFFTTKEAGKGTGLGLSIVKAIVEQSGGSISVDSSPGQGTRFHILLPRGDDSERPPERITPVSDSAWPQGYETILLAEDDDEVREFVEHVLKRSGYQVLAAADGDAARKLAEKFPGDIALLLSDVVMPKVNGRQLAADLEALRPRIKVLHMSGYPGDTIARYGDVREGDAFLQKPFSARELARKVREILDGGGQTKQ